MKDSKHTNFEISEQVNQPTIAIIKIYTVKFFWLWMN